MLIFTTRISETFAPMLHAPRKQACQARAKATQAAIVEAAARILEDEGRDAVTTNRIAERAGVSIGSLYQYFPDKSAILAALLRRERRALADMIVAVRRRSSGLDVEEALLEMIHAALAHQFHRPKLALALEYLEASLDLENEAAALSSQLAEDVLAVIRRHSPTADRREARDTVAICKGIINAAAMAGETDMIDIRSRVMRAVRGYLADLN